MAFDWKQLVKTGLREWETRQSDPTKLDSDNDPYTYGDGPGKFLQGINHATPFNPSNNPVRQKFNGYVNFHFNGDIDIPGISDLSKSGQQTILSSMIKTADIPSAEIQTDVKNQYNKKRITITHAEFKPITISAYDTVDSAWVILLMRMYSHLFSNAMGQYDFDTTGKATPRKIPYDVVPSAIPTGSTEGPTYGFNSTYSDNNMGYNLRPGKEKYMVSHIDIVMFHAQRTIVYTMFNPIVTGFTVDGIDHASSDAVMINMDITYENFTISPVVNGFIPEADMARFLVSGSGEKELYKGVREVGTDIAAGQIAGSQTGNDTRKMASLKSKTLGYLASGNGQNSTSRLTTDQNNNFWKTVAQPAGQAQANPGGQQSDPADTESNKTYTVNGEVVTKEEYDEATRQAARIGATPGSFS